MINCDVAIEHDENEHESFDSCSFSACRQLYVVLSGACLLVGVTTTHGLGGKLWHAGARGEPVTAWRFFQPFKFACLLSGWQKEALISSDSSNSVSNHSNMLEDVNAVARQG
jgi:hypothetical protein